MICYRNAAEDNFVDGGAVGEAFPRTQGRPNEQCRALALLVVPRTHLLPPRKKRKKKGFLRRLSGDVLAEAL
jgi:hypothetical protein